MVMQARLATRVAWSQRSIRKHLFIALRKMCVAASDGRSGWWRHVSLGGKRQHAGRVLRAARCARDCR
eukprot:4531464-Pleurochrysis_carterae.AAC.1